MATEAAPREPDSPRRFDMRALWRVTGWGVAAALALGVLAVTSQSYTGSQRLKLAFTPAELPVRPVAVMKVPPPPPENQAEMARLQAEVNVLAADRDRLITRIASLEHSLNDLTGSIKRLSLPLAPVAAAEPPPNISAPETVAASAKPPANTEAREAKTPEPAASGPPPQQAASAPQAAAPPAAEVPLPPVRLAALPPKPEFGIALAGASSIELLHMQWAAMKANFGPLIGELKPHAQHERHGTASHYRLIIGPLPTYTAAAKLCARLIAARAICHPVKMVGEPL